MLWPTKRSLLFGGQFTNTSAQIMDKILARIIIAICFTLRLAATAVAQPKIIGLLRNAVVVETRRLTGVKPGNRLLALWMISPKKNPTGYAPDDIYTCPDQ